jgi:peptidyl-prolyl cis-trans isomerase A (cyclophilin A)
MRLSISRAFLLGVLVALLAAPAHAATKRDVAIATSAGTIVVRLEPNRAPGTTANFLHYVDTHAYDGASFYRVVNRANEPSAPFEVIQGGINPHGPSLAQPIPLEPTTSTKLHNDDGTIAMARTSDPNSATTEFFIDIGNARYLDAGGPLGPGYAAFGRVVRGMDVVRRIFRSPSQGEALTPAVTIVRMRRV